jgi:23S rRNA (cytidine1920-2'-O)/16S rRNA (cytidine1409-2'-O)-methyltransferase
VKQRADELLVQRGMAPTRSKARALIMAGQVRIGDRIIDKAGTMLDPATSVRVEHGPRYVSRGGEKLRHALDVFGIDPDGSVCADFGASTGGFTDVLLHAGARRVYAIDVGYGQLDYKLRTDPRVVSMERVNVRYLEELPEPIDLVTVDVSFISLALIFPAVIRVLRERTGLCIALAKPQFEAGREHVGKGGVVRDPEIHRRVLRGVAHAAAKHGLSGIGVTASPITGPAGNHEYLMLFCQSDHPAPELDSWIDRAVESVPMRKDEHA